MLRPLTRLERTFIWGYVIGAIAACLAFVAIDLFQAQFLDDTDHALRNQTVDLLPVIE